MPIIFQGVSPRTITFAGQSVRRVTYNGIEVWPGLPARDALQNMSWADISSVSRAGKASEYWQLGDTKQITIGATFYTAQVIGFDHDRVSNQAEYGRKNAGLSFQLVEIYEISKMHAENYSSALWYSDHQNLDSLIRRTRLPSVYAQLSPELQSVIVPVDKEYAQVRDGTAKGGLSSTLWLPSYKELFGGADSAAIHSEGEQYAFYAAGNSKIKQYGGENTIWWTRSPYSQEARFYAVHGTGNAYGYFVTAANTGYAPCFCV